MPIIIDEDLETNLDPPITYPRIMWDSLFRHGTVTSSGDESDEFAKENAAIDPATWNYWRPDFMPNAWLAVELSSAMPADFALLAAHTCGSEGVTVAVQYSILPSPETWVTVGTYAPTDDKIIVFFWPAISAAKWRLLLTGGDVPDSPESIPSIGVFMVGVAMAMPLGCTLDHAPITLSHNTVLQPNRSERGQYLGRSVKREGVGTTIAFANLDADFIRDEFMDFMESARTHPFGWAWAPFDYEDDVAYVWTSEDIRPSHDGQQAYLTVEFTVDGLLE